VFHLIRYDADVQDEFFFSKTEELFPEIDPTKVNWIDIDLSKETEDLQQIAEHFGIHHLVMEDIENNRHLPKFEPFDDYYFLTLKMLSYDKQSQFIRKEHLSIIFGKHYVITIQEHAGDVFDELRERLSKSLGRMRKRQADYLFYRLIDSVVDEYMVIIETLREQIDSMEEYMLTQITSTDLYRITQIKRVISEFRKYVFPLKDEMTRLKNEPCDFLHKNTRPYLQDVIDHLNYVNSNFESFREMVRELMSLYQSQISDSTNRVMKTLTIVASIFIPLTFIAGVYGMNFEYMPELGWKWAYPVVLIVMLLLAVGMGVFMKHRKWL
jgi:magnesium transporter